MTTPAVSTATNRALEDERRFKRNRSNSANKDLYGTIEAPQPDAEILPTDQLAMAPIGFNRINVMRQILKQGRVWLEKNVAHEQLIGIAQRLGTSGKGSPANIAKSLVELAEFELGEVAGKASGLVSWTAEQTARARAAGKRLTPMSLYERQNAPKGTEFVLVKGKPYRVWDK